MATLDQSLAGTNLTTNDAKPNYNADGVDTVPCATECKHKDNRGYCIFESCIFDEMPTAHGSMQIKCMICEKTFNTSPKDVKSNTWICDECLADIKARIKLPFTCMVCGRSQSSKPIIPMSRMCDSCHSKVVAHMRLL